MRATKTIKLQFKKIVWQTTLFHFENHPTPMTGQILHSLYLSKEVYLSMYVCWRCTSNMWLFSYVCACMYIDRIVTFSLRPVCQSHSTTHWPWRWWTSLLSTPLPLLLACPWVLMRYIDELTYPLTAWYHVLTHFYFHSSHALSCAFSESFSLVSRTDSSLLII